MSTEVARPADVSARSPQPAGRRPATVVARLTARHAVLSAVLWGAAFGLVVVSSVTAYSKAYPTLASREHLAQTLGADAGLRALFGQARSIDTVAGFTAWRTLALASLVGAVWGLLTGTRLLRGEEDAGRWELLLTGQTTRRRAAVQGLVGLAGGWLVMWVATAVITLAAGTRADPKFSTSGSLFFSLALTSATAMFLAMGALASQLAATRRRAAGLAATVLGASFLLKLVANSASDLRWMAWVSPLGWVEELHPLTGSQPLALLPIAALIGITAALTVRLAGVRDLGGSVLADHDTARARTRLLGGPVGLAVRLVRPVAAGWIAGLAFCGLLFGLVAQAAASAISGSATIAQTMRRIGEQQFGAQAYLGFVFVIVTTMIAVIAAGQASAMREEEAEGRLENLLVRPLSRVSWLAGRLVVAVVVLIACGISAGVFAWVGAASQHSGVSFTSLFEAGINTVPAALLLLGIGMLTLAFVPRVTAAVVYGLIAWSFLVELVGAVVNASHWLLDTSLLYHVAPAPATSPDWTSALVLTVLGIAAAAIAAIRFARRDLVGA